jgi:membrane associated rhomboid family serine protease
MDRAANGLGSDGAGGLPSGFDAAAQTQLDRPTAVAAITQADEHMERSDPELALPLYARATWINDRDVSAAGFYGLGNALYRLDRETEAREAWERSTSFGDTPVAYRAWRQVAAARVREGDLPGAIDAYHQCERRAPREDRAEIASRLGWLSKETGNAGAANRYFARSRGTALPAFMTYLIMAVTVVTSLAAMSGALDRGNDLVSGSLEWQLALIPAFVAHGEYYRLLSVTLVHDPASYLHLLFNMYALWYAGKLVEGMYGSWQMLLLYAICGIAGGAASFAVGLGENAYGVGASGAIFGLFGVALVATRFHHAILDAQSRAIAAQVGLLIVLNLALGFSGVFNVDNSAHVGGLLAGVWLAFVLPPGKVQTLASAWQGRRIVRSRSVTVALRAGGVAVLLVVIVGVVAYGTAKWQQTQTYRYYFGDAATPAAQASSTTPCHDVGVALVIER